MPKQASPARHWCFTWNNPPEDTLPEFLFQYNYLVYGKENAATGTAHLQGYVSLTTKERLSALVKKFPGIHFEQMRGTSEQAADYCKKDNNFFEFGSFPKTCGEAVKDKYAKIHELAKTNNAEAFYEQHQDAAFLYPQKFIALVQHYRGAPQPLPEIAAWWFMGPSGSGKSRTARGENPGFYLKPSGTKWWDGYNFEDVVLLDDLGKKHDYMLEFLKNWADHYPFRAEVKQAHTGLIRPTTIIVTTQYHWDELTDDPELRAAIARRFKVRTFPEDVEVYSPLVLPYDSFETQFPQDFGFLDE